MSLFDVIAQTNLNTWNVLLFQCRIVRGGRDIVEKNKQKNPTKLFWVQFNILSDS